MLDPVWGKKHQADRTLLLDHVEQLTHQSFTDEGIRRFDRDCRMGVDFTNVDPRIIAALEQIHAEYPDPPSSSGS